MTTARDSDPRKVAIVSGASRGLGAAIAIGLAGRHDLLLHYRSNKRRAEAVTRACRERGAKVTLYQADFEEQPDLAAAMVDSAVARFGRLDILVNNASVTATRGGLFDLDLATFDRVLSANLGAVFLATKTAGRLMASWGRGGRIVNIGSVHGLASAPGNLAYDVSKAALIGLTRSAAVELGGSGVTVNCLAPGTIQVERYGDTDVDGDWLASRVPVARLGEPSEISAAVEFLVSDAAAYLTGQTIVVDGGALARLPYVR